MYYLWIQITKYGWAYKGVAETLNGQERGIRVMQLKGAHINKLVIHSYSNLHLLLALWYVN